MTAEFLTLPDRRLAYQRLDAAKSPVGVVFLGGYASAMTGTKATFLAEFCASAGLPFLRFDYRGNGQSSGDFKNCTLGNWFDDTYEVFMHLTQGPQIVVGSSMGGWLALKLAMRVTERVKAIIGIAAAPDFTENLLWDMLTPEQRAKFQRDGFIRDASIPETENAGLMTWRLVEEARNHLLLRGPIDVKCPVRLLQGKRDKEVPWRYAERITEKITGDDMRITFIDDGDHRLSRPQDLKLLQQTVESLL